MKLETFYAYLRDNKDFRTRDIPESRYANCRIALEYKFKRPFSMEETMALIKETKLSLKRPPSIPDWYYDKYCRPRLTKLSAFREEERRISLENFRKNVRLSPNAVLAQRQST